MSNVSVVIPTYNGARFIHEALESVFAQTLPPMEIIVVDDASTDGTADLVEAIALHSPVLLKLFRLQKNNGSPATPLNLGIENARSRYIALLEQDDLMAPDRLMQQVTALDRHPRAPMAVGRVCLIENDLAGRCKWSPMTPPPDDIACLRDCRDGEAVVVDHRAAFRSLLRHNFIRTNSNITLRKAAWQRSGGFAPEWPYTADGDLVFAMLLLGPVIVANSPLCGYRKHQNSLSRSNRWRAIIDGRLVRLKWALRRPDWSQELLFHLYCEFRWYAQRSLRSGNLRQWSRLWWAMISSGLVGRHILSKVGLVQFP